MRPSFWTLSHGSASLRSRDHLTQSAYALAHTFSHTRTHRHVIAHQLHDWGHTAAQADAGRGEGAGGGRLPGRGLDCGGPGCKKRRLRQLGQLRVLVQRHCHSHVSSWAGRTTTLRPPPSRPFAFPAFRLRASRLQGGTRRDHWVTEGPEFLRHLLESETYSFDQQEARCGWTVSCACACWCGVREVGRVVVVDGRGVACAECLARCLACVRGEGRQRYGGGGDVEPQPQPRLPRPHSPTAARSCAASCPTSRRPPSAPTQRPWSGTAAAWTNSNPSSPAP